MGDMMVIVSKSVFEGERDENGQKLTLGSVYETDVYTSNSKVIEKNLSGDLYLVTVQGERLLLVGRLREPEPDELGWVADANEELIVDITDIAGQIRFDSGKGINLEKMAMSLQTPRVLTDEDVELLNRAWGHEPKPPVEVTAQQIEDAVVKLLAVVLKRTEDEVRSDTARYAAFQWDDGFYDQNFSEIDWETREILSEFDTEDWIFGRNDIDVARSVFEDERFQPSATSDTALREMFQAQEGMLFGEQLAQLILQDRISLDQLSYPICYGRIIAGETLVEAGRGLFLLNDFPNQMLEPGEYAEVDEDWEKVISTIDPPELAAHLGMFFQESEAARCCGAAFGGPEKGTLIRINGTDQHEILVSWWIGEGQGTCYLARILADQIPEVPEFSGRGLLTRHGNPERSERSRLVGSTAEILSKSLATHLDGVKNETYRDFLKTVGTRDLKSFIAGMSFGEPSLWKLLIPLNALERENNTHAAVALLHTIRDVMIEEQRRRTELRWADLLHSVGCFAEAVDAYAECEKIGPECSEYMMENMGNVYVKYARAALNAGLFDLAVSKANAALAVDEELGEAIAIKAIAMFELGVENTVFEPLGEVMRNGTDPEPTPKLAAHPKYRELALANSIPVPVWD